jgi:F-type H+-transporting ATPase subunit gamma
MPSTKQLQRRIKSVSNISQITKAMEMVSASKMRRAQMQAMASRNYSRKLEEIVHGISDRTDAAFHPLLQQHPEAEKQALVLLTSDRGQTGSLNANLFRAIISFQQDHSAEVYTIGRIAKEFAAKSGYNLVAGFQGVGDRVDYQAAVPIASLLAEKYLNGEYSQIWIGYMDFVTTLSQVPKIDQLLPLQKKDISAQTPGVNTRSYIFEPDPQTLLASILPYFVELKIYQSLLEARASEHSARMVAMKNASDNAAELKSNLTLRYNRSRQTNITTELSDIVTATLSITK